MFLNWGQPFLHSAILSGHLSKCVIDTMWTIWKGNLYEKHLPGIVTGAVGWENRVDRISICAEYSYGNDNTRSPEKEKNINLKGLLFNEFYIFGIKIVDDPEVEEDVRGVAWPGRGI